MGVEFTYLQCIRLEAINAQGQIDEAICKLVRELDGKIKNWQVLAPTPQQRILYFEPDDAKPVRATDGYNKEIRNLALGETPQLSGNSTKRKRGRPVKNG